MSNKVDPTSLKRCATCGEYKVRSEGFYYRDRSAHGKSAYSCDSRCKDCRNRQRREWIENKREIEKASRPQLPDGHKLCRKCEQVLPLAEFYPNNATCKSCHRDKHQETYVSRRKVPVMTTEEKANARKQNSYRQSLRDRGYSGPFHTWQEWQGVLDKYGRKCLKCGKPEEHTIMTRDHIVPLADGGLDTIDNIQPLCFNCNARKQKDVVDYRPKD